MGTADNQSLADLNNCVCIVRDTRLVPVSPNLFMYLAVAALLPMMPLVLFKYPLADLLANFFGRLPGVRSNDRQKRGPNGIPGKTNGQRSER